GQDRLGLAVARLLGRAARAVALDEKDLGARGAVARAVGELAGQAELAGRGLARQFALLASPLALLGALHDPIEQPPGGSRIGAQPVIEMVLYGILHQPCRLARGEPLLGLALELRVADEQRPEHCGARPGVFTGRLNDPA